MDPADTAITIDTVTYNNNGGGPFIATLNVNGGLPLSNGVYELFVCGTTNISDLIDQNIKLAGNGTTPGTDFIRNFSINITAGGGGGNGGGDGNNKGGNKPSASLIPVTGFAPNQITKLPAQPADKAYTSLNGMTLEIPVLSVKSPIVSVSIQNNNWDLTWLGSNVGYLEGSAYPTWRGNTVLTAHGLDASNVPGPFAYLKDLQKGDKVYIHAYGQIYIYEVREMGIVQPTNINVVFKHEEYDWLTLVTCENFDKVKGSYASRRMVRAVLISVIDEAVK